MSLLLSAKRSYDGFAKSEEAAGHAANAKTIADLINKDGIFVDGDWVETKDQDPEGDVRLIQLADVGDGTYRNRSGRFLTSAKARELGCTFLKAGDLLIARMPEPLGRACIFPGDEKPSVTVVDVCIVRTGEGGTDHRWLMHRINSAEIRGKISELQSGSTRKRISRSNLARIRFDVPQVDEQRCVVAEIEKQFTRLDAGVVSLKRVRTALKRYRASVLKAASEGKLLATEIRNWRTVDFGELCHVQGGYAFKSAEYQSSGVPLVRIANLVDGQVIFDEKTARLPRNYLDEFKEFRLSKGDVLIAMSGATTGKMATFELGQPALLNQRVGRFQVKKGGQARADYLALIVEQIGHQVLHDAYGAAQPNISPKKIESMKFLLPPFAEQIAIVAEVERRMSVMENLRSSITGAVRLGLSLRRSILSRAFSRRV